MTLLCTKYHQNWSMSVEDIAWLKRPISGVHDSQGSAKTLVRRSGITNHHLITYSFSNTSAKKLPKSVDVHCSYSVQGQCRFFETQSIYTSVEFQFKQNCWRLRTRFIAMCCGVAESGVEASHTVSQSYARCGCCSCMTGRRSFWQVTRCASMTDDERVMSCCRSLASRYQSSSD